MPSKEGFLVLISSTSSEKLRESLCNDSQAYVICPRDMELCHAAF
jgi:hypothetical protein